MLSWMVTGVGVPPDALDIYRATMRARDEAAARQRESRRRRAWQVAQQAADLLRREFGAERVVAFGSLVHGHWFTVMSDVDLAAWGLGVEEHLVAIAALQDLAGGLHVDLVRAERGSQALLAVIEAEGVEL
jgi:predicted nucleotidyltransferase